MMEKPVFVGHYWMKGELAPMSEHAACLDYSIAGSNGVKLCAYRLGTEAKLEIGKFDWVERHCVFTKDSGHTS